VEEAKLGTLCGSLVAAIAGYTLFRFAPPHPGLPHEEFEQALEIAADGDVETITVETK